MSVGPVKRLLVQHLFCTKPLLGYKLSSVWVRLSIFSQLSITQYVRLCVFSLPISFVMIERIYILCLIIIMKSEVWTITHCLGLGHETMVCAVCLSIFFWTNAWPVIMWHIYYGPHLYGCSLDEGHTSGLVQERRNSIANALELRYSLDFSNVP